jgi:hypothetical protein
MVMPMMPGMMLGMFVLVLPSFLVCSGIAYLVYKRWNATAER